MLPEPPPNPPLPPPPDGPPAAPPPPNPPLPPYALALAVSLEPVYAMGLAWFIFPDAEQLTWRFYAGCGVLLVLVAFNTWRKQRTTSLHRE